MKTRRSWFLFACATASAIAQSVAPPPLDAASAKYDLNKNGVLEPEERAAMEKDATVLLTPFEVRTDKDIGYQAIDAGTGGRVDLPFKMTASAMSAITKEFMEDWSITDMRDAFRYAMNIDPAGSSNGTPFGDFEYNSRGSNFPGAGGTGSFPTRNGFLSYSVYDSYNAERFEFSGGPNSILFGDGQIGGLAGTSTKEARFNRNLYSGSARWDSWGGWRFTADANEVVSKKFAARLNLLYQKDTFGAAWRDGVKSRDQGADLALAYAFTPNTVLKVDTEFDNRRNISIATTYSDQVGYYSPGYTYDRLTPNLPASQTDAGISAVSGNAENWTYIPALAKYGLFNTGGNQYYRSTGPGFAIQPEGRSDLPGIATRAKLPSREFTLGANDVWSRFKQQTYTVALEHRFSDQVSGRVSFYDYNNDRNQKNASAGTLQMDINKFGPDGLPNPKLGVLYGEASPGRSVQENYVYEWRGLLTYRTPLPFWHSKGQFAFVGGVRNERFEAANWIAARIDGTNPIYSNAANSIRYRFYVDEPMKYSGNDLPADKPGFTYRFIQNPGNIQWKSIEYAQFVSALSMLDDRISLVLGTRNDFYSDDQIANISGFDDIHGIRAIGTSVAGVGNVKGAHALTKSSAITSNAGIVAWVDKGQHVGVFYNWSENFSPATSSTAAPITSFNADGTVNFGSPTPQSGSGNEMGLKFNFLNDRFSAEARYYKNKFVDKLEGPSVSGNFASIWNSSGPAYNANTGLTQVSFRDVFEGETSGYEFKAVANIRGLRLSANYALPETSSGVSRAISQAYFNTFLARWTQWSTPDANGNYFNDKGQSLTTAEGQNIAQQITNIQNSFAGTVTGTTNNGTNKWTGSLAATYQFSRESKLRGFSAGWAVNGRGKRKIGSVDPVIKYNLTAVGSRAATPAERAAAAFDYIYQKEYYTQDVNFAYRRRIGKYNYRFQLNVNNVTDKDDLLFGTPSTYRVLGQGAVVGAYNNGFSYLDPRKFMLTTSIDF